MIDSKPVGSQMSKDRNLNPAGAVGSRRPLALLLPLYVVIFVGFAAYSLMITVFTPLLLHGNPPLLAAGDSMRTRTIVLGILLCLYPLCQFLGSPILGWFSDDAARCFRRTAVERFRDPFRKFGFNRGLTVLQSDHRPKNLEVCNRQPKELADFRMP